MLILSLNFLPCLLVVSFERTPLSLACLGAEQAAERFMSEAAACQWNITMWARGKEGEWNSTQKKQQEIINKSQESTASKEVKLADALRDKAEVENRNMWHPPWTQFWGNQHEFNSSYCWLLAWQPQRRFPKISCLWLWYLAGAWIHGKSRCCYSVHNSSVLPILSLNDAHCSLGKKAGV